ncbi:glycosyltransferase [Pararoseomonas sp. SCSIO 73927]|uniref:CgeB family protein n=1 Tax=Pararoseomonas sp. SCSIO 73927 TaxID=3114537 RepID=UPI0030CE3026
MRLVVFGLAVSSSWGNGHAALWRALIAALLAEGHRVTFFERDVPYYAENRDLHALPEGGELVLYKDWAEALPKARRALAECDAGMVTSYCPDAGAATALLMESRALRVFYDLDTPVTLARLDAGEDVGYIGPEGLGGFDLVLSYTGGAALDALRTRLGARRVAPLYGSADPTIHAPAPAPADRYALSYLGTYAEDRQAALETLFLAPARQRPESRFVIGGAQYPQDFPWGKNIWFRRHLPPPEHAAFYAGSRLTLNITRAAMAASGWCPSGRLFEAAACNVALLSDNWDGLDTFFEPGREILIASTTEEALAALDLSDEAVATIARRGRERCLAEHTATRRAREMVEAIEAASSPALSRA